VPQAAKAETWGTRHAVNDNRAVATVSGAFVLRRRNNSHHLMIATAAHEVMADHAPAD